MRMEKGEFDLQNGKFGLQKDLPKLSFIYWNVFQ